MIQFKGEQIIVDTLPRDIAEYVREMCFKGPLDCSWDQSEGFVVTLDELITLMCALHTSTFTYH